MQTVGLVVAAKGSEGQQKRRGKHREARCAFNELVGINPLQNLVVKLTST